jgi:hypothetical protein
VNPPGVHFCNEQDIESVQRDGVEGEEVGGQQPSSLGAQEAPPPGVRSTWCRPKTGSGQDPADRAGTEAVSEPEEFTLDATVTPGRILLRQAHHEAADLVTDRWAAGPVRIGAVPCQNSVQERELEFRSWQRSWNDRGPCCFGCYI